MKISKKTKQVVVGTGATLLLGAVFTAIVASINKEPVGFQSAAAYLFALAFHKPVFKFITGKM